VFGNCPNSGAAGVHEASIHDAGQAFVLTHSTVGRPRDFYAEFLSIVGIRHFLIPLAPQGQIDYRILLRRTGGREFTERERLMLSLARPQIAKIHEALLRKRHVTEFPITARQEELLRQLRLG
jgi:hypothetical protein